VNFHVKSIIKLLVLSLLLLVGCSDEPTAGSPNTNQPDMVQDMDRSDGDGVVDMNPDMEQPAIAQPQRLVIQPVSGSGSIGGAKFKAHIQIGRVIDATSK
jgi:hypothetical protein